MKKYWKHFRAGALLIAIIMIILSYNNCGSYKFVKDDSAAGGSDVPFGNTDDPITFDKSNCNIGYPYVSSNAATKTLRKIMMWEALRARR